MKIPIIYERRNGHWTASSPVCTAAFGQGATRKTRKSAKGKLINDIRQRVEACRTLGFPSPFEKAILRVEDVQLDLRRLIKRRR